ncbi:class III lanthionine synthetase LanKC [Streptomyces sp. L-9-10]|uniref:class III lanthionine synthetase LanKC n=1 Tax=Streptomyces sp. L-9-10 TaxID=1478131 RepID=UPI0013EAB057|nr:class III lanthionine synthetase LanKC [Streptomyces sp. L-9-10]
MDPRYEAYVIADSTWYEPLDRCDDSASRFALSAGELPAGWHREHQGVWEFLRPADSPALPEQGWKIHISATPDSAEKTVGAAWEICQRLGLPWKFLRSRRVVAAMNTKYANRAASGKAVTVYPRTPDELREAVTELDAALSGHPGPYVLSDYRWNDGPVSLRYGAFTLMWCELRDGTRVPALRHPQGHAVQDPRRPVFTVPEWAEIPDFLADRFATATTQGGDATVGGYRVIKALHFSNGGGVYLAEDEQGEKVVLKEARPHAGLDAHGVDAVHRLHIERDILEKTAQLPFMPRLLDSFTSWEHHYLAMEYIEGETFSAWLGRDYPLTLHRPGDRARADFAALAVDLLDQVGTCLSTLHEAGIAFGDLHHRNILIRPDRTVALVDCELAVPVDSERTAGLGAPGFMDASITRARDADLFALGCCQLATLAPLTVLTVRNPEAVRTLVELAATAFPTLPAGFIDRMTEHLALSAALRPHLPPVDARSAAGGEPADGNRADGNRADGNADGERADAEAASPPLSPPSSGELLRGLVRSATVDRTDRLFPCDVSGYRPGAALGLAYGAPGVLLAQLSADTEPAPEHVEWLLQAVRRAPADTPPGLYDGLSGATWLLHRLGHPDVANAVDRILAGPLPASPGLFCGLSGIAHLLLDVGARTEALALASRVREQIGRAGALDRPGLMHGWSGPAVLLARCAEETGDAEWAEAAVSAVRCDLRHGRTMDGMLQMHSSNRLLPYLAEGSAGVAFAAMALPEAQAEAVGADDIVTGAARAGAVRVVIQGGLFSGRAGLAYFLSHAAARAPRWAGEADEQLTWLSLHLARHGDSLVLHGDQLMRLSTDLATGSAGALLALEAAKNPGRRLLPGAHPTYG